MFAHSNCTQMVSGPTWEWLLWQTSWPKENLDLGHIPFQQPLVTGRQDCLSHAMKLCKKSPNLSVISLRVGFQNVTLACLKGNSMQEMQYTKLSKARTQA